MLHGILGKNENSSCFLLISQIHWMYLWRTACGYFVAKYFVFVFSFLATPPNEPKRMLPYIVVGFAFGEFRNQDTLLATCIGISVFILATACITSRPPECHASTEIYIYIYVYNTTSWMYGYWANGYKLNK